MQLQLPETSITISRHF